MKTQPAILFIFLSIMFFSCKKETVEEELPVDFLDTLSIPATFQQNIVFEVFTGTWCQYCPKADCQIEDLMEANPRRMFAVAIHSRDVFDIDNDSIKDYFDVGAYPHKTFNYCDYFYSTSTKYSSYLNQAAKFGMALTSAVENDTVTLRVMVGFKETISKNLKLVVYLTEDGLIATQSSDYDNDPSSCYYHRGSYIHDYVHENVLRDHITSSIMGDVIKSSEAVAGNKIIRTYNFTINPKWDKEHLKITAFVTDGNILSSSASGYHRYFNGNQARPGETVAWN